ncbi:hypothetical protein D3C86_1113090 [compost metagenome]
MLGSLGQVFELADVGDVFAPGFHGLVHRLETGGLRPDRVLGVGTFVGYADLQVRHAGEAVQLGQGDFVGSLDLQTLLGGDRIEIADVTGTASGGAELVGELAELFLVLHGGDQGAGTHRGTERLGHGNHALGAQGRQAATDTGVGAGDVGGGHPGVLTVDEVTAGAQLGFEQQGAVLGLDGLERLADVADGVDPGGRHFQQPVGHFLGGLAELEARIEGLELRQFPVEEELDAFDQYFRLFQPADQDRLFHDPITVSRGNALTGGAIGAITQTNFFQGIFQGVDRQAEGGAVGDGELRSHAGGFHFSQFLGQRLRADDHARAEDNQAIRVEDAAWQLVQLEGAKIVDHGVAGVVAALETDAGGGLACQIIDDAAFAFITPVSTYDYDRRHDSFS